MEAILIPAGTHRTDPIHVTRPAEDSELTVVVEDGASATVIDEIAGGDASHALDVTVGARATLTYVSFEHADSSAKIQIRQKGSIGTEGKIAWVNATLGGAEINHELTSTIDGEGAQSEITWMFYGKGHEKQSLRARNVFNGRHGGGEITMKGVAEEKAHVQCKGMIDIGLQGGGTDTYLTQDVLMLDPGSRVDAVPALEIKTNDVKASHSATISRVTDEDLFYFAARGIGEREARRMFVEGFLAQLTAKISDASVRESIEKAIEAKYAIS